MTKPHRQKPTLSAQVVERVRHERIAPRGSLSILAEQAGYAVLFLTVFVIGILAINWIGFWLRVGGFGDFLGLGPLGLMAFVSGFPYGLLVLFILAYVLTLALLRHYDLSYRQPILLLAAGLLVSALLVGAGLAKSGLNERIAERVEQGQLQPLRVLYQHRLEFRHQSGHAVAGPVVDLGEHHLTILIRRGEVTLETDEQTQYPNGRPELDDHVRALIERIEERDHPLARIILIHRAGP